MNKIKVTAHATLSNLCCGFDILGMALSEPFDTIELSVMDMPGILLKHHDSFGLPEDPAVNISGVALQSLMQAAGVKHGFRVDIHKHIKPGSGIGSSAASAAGVVVAANELLGRPFNKQQLVSFAMDGEVLASGSRHADNLAPGIYGGLVLIRDTASLDIIELDAPPLFITLVHPQIEIKTSYAREILPKEIPLKSAVTQWANVAGLVSGFLKKDISLIGRSLQDIIVEPVRCKLIPGFDDVKKRSMSAGALGGGISGSGPSLFMISAEQQTAQQVAKEMASVYDGLGIDYKTYVSTLASEGVKVVEMSA
jgi:homoserine kinase